MPASFPILLAGYPDRYPNVYHRTRLAAGDMVVFIERLPGLSASALIVRNIEVDRARKHGRAADVFCPEDLAPAAGLDSDRNTAFAQATAELLRRRAVTHVVSDQMLPLLFVDVLAKAGIQVECDRALGIMERRRKDAWEVDQLRTVQGHTEAAIRRAYEVLRAAKVVDGVLQHDGRPLTSDALRIEIDRCLMERNCISPESIVAGGPIGADCHHRGEGVLRVSEPIIVDVFPMHKGSRYFGDCTRTFVRGPIPREVAGLHAAVVEAKAAAIAACRAGARGADVHAATTRVLAAHKAHIGLPPADAPPTLAFCPHGTGHGVGLECHEPPILDALGPELVDGDALTIEPGLYCKAIGGVRVEDMVIVRPNVCDNLNRLPEGLWWD